MPEPTPQGQERECCRDDCTDPVSASSGFYCPRHYWGWDDPSHPFYRRPDAR